MLLSQHKYIRDVLNKFDLSATKEVYTLMATNVKLQLKDGFHQVDAIVY